MEITLPITLFLAIFICVDGYVIPEKQNNRQLTLPVELKEYHGEEGRNGRALLNNFDVHGKPRFLMRVRADKFRETLKNNDKRSKRFAIFEPFTVEEQKQVDDKGNNEEQDELNEIESLLYTLKNLDPTGNNVNYEDEVKTEQLISAVAELDSEKDLFERNLDSVLKMALEPQEANTVSPTSCDQCWIDEWFEAQINLKSVSDDETSYILLLFYDNSPVEDTEHPLKYEISQLQKDFDNDELNVDRSNPSAMNIFGNVNGVIFFKLKLQEKEQDDSGDKNRFMESEEFSV